MRVVLTGPWGRGRRTSSPIGSRRAAIRWACKARKTHPDLGTEIRGPSPSSNHSLGLVQKLGLVILHAPTYRKCFANDLSKELPRIPFAPDFHVFAEAGRELAELHLGYENCEEYPLEVSFTQPIEPRPEHFRVGRQVMRFGDDKKTILRVNDHVSLRAIPTSAHEYQVNGRPPLEWFINRYRIVQHKESGIVNDPNDWFEHPRDLTAAIRRIVHLSVETARIIEGLPEPITDLDLTFPPQSAH